ncbi:hypothetical protein CTI12_AA021670 [Artemisia annua]|uniref:Coiled-coil domain-containing protein 84 n=1 Tax=Artemisia annua TaxID=35608 RepID=A0A2U1QJX5_ARTAN|nr:hypothetical protein CTI12_AA021670 [Artemisia annua]
MNPPSKTTTKANNYEFCKVCKINHNLGRRHNYLPNHIKSLSSYLSKFQSKLTDIRLFVKNPRLVGQEINFRKSFWCVFCDVDVAEETGCEFACEKAISHLASADHLKNVKSFIWKYGGGMDQVDRFRVSEVDLAKYEKKCMSMKSERGGEQSHGPLIGPSNDIHNELKYDYVDNCDKSHISSYNITFPNHVLPLQNHTNENYQVSHSDHYGGAATSTSSSYDEKPVVANTKHFNNLKGNTGRNCLKGGYHDKGLGKTCQVYAEKGEANGEGSSAGLLKLTQISSKVHEVNAGNVHSGAPPPWFDTTNEVHLDPGLKPVTKTVKSKLNPKRVGAAWAEKRKLEMEMERRGELPTSNFDANWLPNFGRVWQSGSRKDSRKEFETEAKKPLTEETQSDSSLQLQPYVSKRMNPRLVGQGVDFRKSFWCVFCDVDVSEDIGCEFACEKAISHLASADHLKNVKSFIWKYGGGMDRVDHFRVSEADLAKYEKKCMSMKREGGGEQSYGPLIGPSNDIHNELKYDYVDNCDKSHISSYNITIPNHVLPLQHHTNENYQVSHSDHYGGAATSTSFSYDNKSLLLAANTKHFNNLNGNTGRNCLKAGYHDNGLGKTCQVYAEKGEANGEGSSEGLLKLTQISSKVHEVNAGNVHSGAPPPWFDTTNEVHLDPGLKPVTKTVKSKLNPKRVGAAWAEKRKLEMEMERRGELPTSNFDANWLPNFGRVWQSGSRKDSRKEFETEAKKPLIEETQSDSSLQLQPYVSKRMRREANG